MVIKYLFSLLDVRYKRRFIFFFFLIIINSLVDMLGIAFIIPYLAILQNPQAILEKYPQLNSLLSLFHLNGTSLGLVILASICFFFLLSIRTLFNALTLYYNAKFSYGLIRDWVGRLYDQYMRTNYSYFSSKNSSYLIKNCTKTIEIAAYGFVVYGQYLAATTTIIGLVSLIIMKDPMIALIFMGIFLGLGFCVYKLLRKRQYQAGTLREHSLGELHQRTSESFLCYKEIALCKGKSLFSERIYNSLTSISKALRQQFFFQNLPAITNEFVAFNFLVIAVLVALWQGVPLSVFVPYVIFYGAVAKRLLPNINLALTSKVTFEGTRPSIELLAKELIESSQALTDEKYPPISFKHEFLLKDISFSYEENTPVLNSLTFSLNKNQSVAIVGPSGAGKTTLIEVLTGLLTPQSGHFMIDGEKVHDIRGLRPEIGYVPQMVNLLDTTIAENVAFGEHNIDDNKLKRAITMAHLNHFVEGLPRGLNTIIGERGIRISGGQRQRIGIARALYHNPEILLFDEATASLDNIAEKVISDTIRELSGQKTMIVIAHRLSTIQHFDTIYVLDQGQMVAKGRHAELMQNCSVYQALNLAVSKETDKSTKQQESHELAHAP
ncbi:ABC transporter ATP-binding protein [Simkania negevensis]|uniref:ABC transporter ATP-binding protein n=1 Tax=Simkania negevensis TaxID=83561 RepID=A0ABS3ATS4_9BACT|nr:ABC transporter ATP-binding protein [Simkania negevensis]